MVNLQVLKAQVARLKHDHEAVSAAASGREYTAEENAKLDEIEKQIEARTAQIAQLEGPERVLADLNRLTGGAQSGGSRFMVSRLGPGKSLGQQFVEHPEMKAWLEATRGNRAGRWESPTIELHAATLTEDPASGGDLVIPDYRPGIIPTPLPLPTIADLLGPGTTTSNAVVYMQETAFNNFAAAVAEGAVKPESGMTFDAKNEPVKKVATWIPVTDEMLDDVAQIRSYIDARLIAGVRVALDFELLKGDGTGAHFLGLLNRPGLTVPLPVGTMTPADAIATQAANILVASEGMYPVDAVVLHPLDYLIIVLAKNTTEDYLSGGPFASPLPRTLWGYPVALSTRMTRGEALIGAFKTAAQFFRRGGYIVRASDSHEDFFIRDLQAIRCHARGSLAVYRPAAFGLVTGILPPAP